MSKRAITVQNQGEAPVETREHQHDRPVAAPLVDIFENEQEYLLRADVPGVSREDVDIQYDRGLLTLEAEQKNGHSGEPLRGEWVPVLFRRVFRLPEKIDADKIAAELRHGVLELKIPKSPEVRPRRIQINAA